MPETMVMALQVNKELFGKLRKRVTDKEMNLTSILDEYLKDCLKKQ